MTASFTAFGDELTKIAFFKKMKDGFVNALKEGWHGTTENPQSWMGQGRKMAPGMSRMGRAWEDFSSLGGATKALPVGGKSMMLLGTGLMAREALRKQDPSGQERSRSERMSGLAGNTVGGLVGSAIGSRYGGSSRLLAPMLGGIAGGMVGERVMAAPFAASRKARLGRQQQQMQPQPQVQGVPA